MVIAIQTIEGNFSLLSNSHLCRFRCLTGNPSLCRLNMWARRYSPTADNPDDRLQPKVGAPKRKMTLYCLNWI